MDVWRAMDRHAVHCCTLNQLLGTLLAIVLELASRFHIQLQPHTFPGFEAPNRAAPTQSPSRAASSGSFEFLHPDSPSQPQEQQLLDPPRCDYRCRWCSEPCSRIPGQHKHHSCWEHRHR